MVYYLTRFNLVRLHFVQIILIITKKPRSAIHQLMETNKRGFDKHQLTSLAAPFANIPRKKDLHRSSCVLPFILVPNRREINFLRYSLAVLYFKKTASAKSFLTISVAVPAYSLFSGIVRIFMIFLLFLKISLLLEIYQI